MGMALTFNIALMFSFVGILSGGLSPVKQKSDSVIMLRDEKINFKPEQFYIAAITDDGNKGNAVALLLESNTVNHSMIQKRLYLKGGTGAAVENFVRRNLQVDTLLRPVVIDVKEFALTETALPKGQVGGHLSVVFSFALKKAYGTLHLIDYNGGIQYERTSNTPVDAEAILRQGITRALGYFNTWINTNAENNILLARRVVVRFTDYTEKPEGDTIYYAVNRPLTWDDFKDRPRENGFEAEVFTGIGYTERSKVEGGIINVDMAIKVDAAKSDCWVREGGRDAYVLNHEQRHFDIEKIVGEHFKQKISAMHLPPDNFDGPINVEYLETLREATRMQKQYDAETKHGLDRQAQEHWNENIDNELRKLGVKK
jgi:hypothetical protein